MYGLALTSNSQDSTKSCAKVENNIESDAGLGLKSSREGLSTEALKNTLISTVKLSL